MTRGKILWPAIFNLCEPEQDIYLLAEKVFLYQSKLKWSWPVNELMRDR